jgi:hypothetical protein
MRSFLILSLSCLLAASQPASAAAQPGSQGSLPPVQATRLAAPVVIDGLLNEPAWQLPPTISRLTQSEPNQGAAPTESTQVWVAWDDDALYIAARLWDSRPDSVAANLVRRDVNVAGDRFMLYLDPFHDHRGGYYFGVSAAGVLLDGTLFNDGWDDDSWDGVWEGRARRDGQGWTCELRVPFSQLRFRRGAEQVWGINFRRRIERRSEDDRLTYTPRKESGFVSRFPDLVGMRNGHASRTIEVLPYVTGKAEYLAHRVGDPFNDGSRHTPGLGGDLRMAVGNSLTLNGTVNPDFGQVEVDPAVVNLSDVESYFQEKRPFFTENSRIFSFGNEGANDYWGFNWPEPTFFYSRRIGRTPQGGVPEGADFADLPLATHILGAAKLTGKLTPNFNFGTLHAFTSRETAEYALGSLRAGTEVEPPSYYGVMRGQQEFQGGLNGLGAMASLVQRHFGAGELGDALQGQGLMAGLDGWHFLDRRKMWVLSGWAAMSRVAGSVPSMIALQRGPRHYLQRPDVGYLGVDSSATSLTGYGARVWLNKQEGNFFSNSALGFVRPEFDVGDMGYQSFADVVNGHVGAGYRWTEPNAWRKYILVLGAAFRGFDFGGNKTGEGYFVGTQVEFVNNYSLRVDVSVNPPTLNARRTRGGPLTVNPASGWTRIHFDTDEKARLFYFMDAEADVQPGADARSWSCYPGVEWKPVSNLSLSVGPGFEGGRNDAQYVDGVLDPGNVPADFGGYHYVFARLDQKTVSANLRLNVSFTPRLSLQTFIQPLISAARYTDFKELARSRSYDFIPHGATPPFALRDPSRNFKSQRGNAVVRWEYRPGSVLYFVWTQERTDFEPRGDLRFGPSTRRLFDAQANDIFLVKATYYLNL